MPRSQGAAVFSFNRAEMKSDQELTRDIHEALAGLPTVLADNIEVDASEGVVTLTGNVRSNSEKWATDDAVSRLVGVKDLRNQILVVPGQDRQPDGDVARAWFP